MQNLNGKWVLITGAASGIGKEEALLFTKEGCKLVLVDINESGLEELSREIKEMGGEILSKVTDVTSKEQINELAREVEEKIGAIDILVNNAGIGLSAELKNTTEVEWERLMNINFYSAVRMTNAFLPQMIERRSGQILNMSTGQVFFPVPTWGAYAATKAALATYSDCLTWELRRFGIKVTTAFPGLINTPFYNKTEAQAATFPQKLVMWWIRTLGSSPEKMAAKIVAGIKKGKRRVIQSWINWLTYLGRKIFPPAFDIAGDAFALALGEKGGGTSSRPSLNRGRVLS